MKIFHCEQRTPEWEAIRRGVITGTKLKGLLGRTRQDWIYQLVAERLSIGGENETDLARGVRLEDEAREKFMEATGKKVEQVGFAKGNNEWIGLSPDGLIKNKGKYTEAIEIKCLAGKNHVKAFFERKVPSEYEEQVLQYFIVNKDLKKLYFVFYDDRIQECPLIIIEVNRKEIEEEIKLAEQSQKEALEKVEELLEKILFN